MDIAEMAKSHGLRAALLTDEFNQERIEIFVPGKFSPAD